MPSRLRPTSSVAPDAILVGDPGRALLLAQELLVQPKMSNHARGLWGYGGRTPAGRELTVQATGMGGPSAAIVLADLAKLGVARTIRVGTCVGLDDRAELGELLLVEQAIAAGGSAGAFDLAIGDSTDPDPTLLARLRDELDDTARVATVASFDALPTAGVADSAAADLQTVAVLAQGARLGVAAAALLIVSEAGDEKLPDDTLATVAKAAGRAASGVLSA